MHRVRLLVLLSLGWLWGCTLLSTPTPATPTPAPDTPTPAATATPTSSPTPTLPPTATPTPQPSPTPTPHITELGPLPAGAIARFGKSVLQEAIWNASGTLYAVATNEGVFLYSAQHALQGFLLSPSPVHHIGNLDTDTLVTANADGTLTLWSIPEQRAIATLSLEQGSITALDAHVPTQRAAVGTDTGQVYLLHADGTLTALTPPENPKPVTALALSPKGSVLAAGFEDGTVALWNLQTLDAPPRTFRAHRDRVTVIAFSPPPNTALITGGADERLYAWDIASGEKIRAYPTLRNQVTSVDFTLLGDLMLGGTASGDLLIWDPNSGILGQRLSEYHKDSIHRVDIQPAGNLALTTGADGMLTVFDIASRSAVFVDDAYGANVQSAAFHPLGHLLALGTASGRVDIWNPQTQERLYTLEAHQAPITSVAFSQDGQYLGTVDLDGRVFIWNTNAWTQAFYRFYGPGVVPVRDLTFAPDNTFLTGVAWTNLYIWDMEEEKNKFVVPEDLVLLQSLALHPSGNPIALGTEDGRVLLWDPIRWEFQGTLTGMEASILALQYDTSGERLIGLTQQEVLVWRQGPEPESRHPLPFQAQDMLLLPDGRLLVVGAGWGVLDLSSGALTPLPAVYAAFIQEVHLAPQQGYLVTVARDGSVILWDMNALLP